METRENLVASLSFTKVQAQNVHFDLQTQFLLRIFLVERITDLNLALNFF